jgi:hypothetical protein
MILFFNYYLYTEYCKRYDSALERLQDLESQSQYQQFFLVRDLSLFCYYLICMRLFYNNAYYYYYYYYYY